MEGQREGKGPYIAINRELINKRIFKRNKKKVFSFFTILLHRAARNIPTTVKDGSEVVTVYTNKKEWREYIREMEHEGVLRVITMTDIKSFLRKLEKEGLAILEWDDGDLKITFSPDLMYYGED